MRKNEKERLARRAAYQQARTLAKPFKVEVTDMTIEEFDARQDLGTAYHEAGHAVAAWIQGIDASMCYVPKGTLTHGKDFIARTETSPRLDRFMTEPSVGAVTVRDGIITDSRGVCIGRINDGGVTAYRHAFITVAGPFAEIFTLGEILPLEVYRHSFQIHGDEARTTLRHFSLNPQPDEIQAAHKRIADLVGKTFQEPRVIACVRALAERFHKARKLNEQEVRETIEAEWNTAAVNEHAESAKAGK